MTTNEELERNLLKLFSPFSGKPKEDYLFEKIDGDQLTIKETEASGKMEVTFKNGCFTRFNEKMLGTNKFIGFFNKQDGAIIRRICDGIFLVNSNKQVVLCLVELKKNINNNFEWILKQIEGSYLKITMLLSLLCSVKDIGLAVFIAGKLEKIGDDPDIDYLEKTGEFRESSINPEAKLKEFSLHGEVRMNFPFFLEKTIHVNYQRKDIGVFHLKDGETFDMRNL